MPLLSSSRKATVLAPPLPVQNSFFQRIGLVYRRGQFSLLAAGPGVGKTLFATNLAINLPASPAEPDGYMRNNLYFSADSDEWTVKQRSCSILTDTDLQTVEQQLNEESWERYYTDRLRAVDHIDWCYNPDIDMEFIAQRILAHTEQRGEPPQLVVVDNLGNSVVDQDNEGAELRSACRELQRMARSTRTHIMALHHTVGKYENGDTAIPLNGLLYNLGKIPEVVMSLHWPNPQDKRFVQLTLPKYRGGPQGATVNLPIDYTRAKVGGFGA